MSILYQPVTKKEKKIKMWPDGLDKKSHLGGPPETDIFLSVAWVDVHCFREMSQCPIFSH